jgi:uncharacterized protein YneR
MVMNGCDNGTTPEVRVIAEQYRGKFGGQSTAYYLLKESSIESYNSNGDLVPDEGRQEAYTEGVNLFIKSDDRWYLQGHFSNLDTLNWYMILDGPDRGSFTYTRK